MVGSLLLLELKTWQTAQGMVGKRLINLSKRLWKLCTIWLGWWFLCFSYTDGYIGLDRLVNGWWVDGVWVSHERGLIYNFHPANQCKSLRQKATANRNGVSSGKISFWLVFSGSKWVFTCIYCLISWGLVAPDSNCQLSLLIQCLTGGDQTYPQDNFHDYPVLQLRKSCPYPLKGCFLVLVYRLIPLNWS